MAKTERTYQANLIRIIDGDTVVATIDLGLGVKVIRHIRIQGVNCPEMNAHIAGYRARNACVAWWAAQKGKATLITDEHTDHYGRLLGDFGQNLRGRIVNRLSNYLLKHGCQPL